MSQAMASPPPFDDVISFVVINWHYLPFLVLLIFIFFVSFWCFVFIVYRNYQSRHPINDIEQGLPSTDNNSSNDQVSRNQGGGGTALTEKEKEQRAFKEVLWKVSKSQITEDRSIECSICLEEFSDEDQCRVRPECNHIFHKPCIDMWLGNKTRCCPLCRGFVCRSLSENDDSS